MQTVISLNAEEDPQPMTIVFFLFVKSSIVDSTQKVIVIYKSRTPQRCRKWPPPSRNEQVPDEKKRKTEDDETTKPHHSISITFIERVQRYKLVVSPRRISYILVASVAVEERQQIVTVWQLQRIIHSRIGPDGRRIVSVAWKRVGCSRTGIISMGICQKKWFSFERLTIISKKAQTRILEKLLFF